MSRTPKIFLYKYCESFALTVKLSHRKRKFQINTENMPATTDTTTDDAPAEPSVTRSRATLSVRAGVLSRSDAASGAVRRITPDRVDSSVATAPQNGVMPLKHLTAGRKELRIGHDGATYLLRITKSNKLILTKADDATKVSSIS